MINDILYHFAVCEFKDTQLHWGEHPQKETQDTGVKSEVS